jgi:hypothetical protein
VHPQDGEAVQFRHLHRVFYIYLLLQVYFVRLHRRIWLANYFLFDWKLQSFKVIDLRYIVEGLDDSTLCAIYFLLGHEDGKGGTKASVAPSHVVNQKFFYKFVTFLLISIDVILEGNYNNIRIRCWFKVFSVYCVKVQINLLPKVSLNVCIFWYFG